jgi:hypothetical protein
MALKVSTSNRIIIFLLFLILILGFAYHRLVFKNSDCFISTQNSNSNSFYANIKGQEIDVIGWYHGTTERDLAQLAMTEAFQYAKKGKCSLAKEKIESAMIKLSDQKIESLNVFNELNEIYKKRTFKKLAVEYGPEQYKEEFIDSKTQQDLSTEFISMFKNLCPEHVQKFSDLYLIFPGPEYKFALDHKSSVEIAPVGNDELIRSSFLAYTNESRLFSQQVDQLSPAALHAYNQFIDMTKNGQALVQSKIDELTINLPDPEKSKLQKYFYEASKVFDLLQARDIAFVDEILKSKSNIAVVIGNFHVPAFKKILMHKCESDEK